MKKPWFLPKGKFVWLLFDTANGDELSKRYVWWFDTKKAAQEYKKWQHSNKKNVRLVGPIRFEKVT